jgi:hypothetical protein
MGLVTMTIMDRIAKVDAAIETRAAAKEFVEYARTMLLARGTPVDALAMAESRRIHATPRTIAVLKAAVAAGTTSDAVWAESLSAYRSLSEGFIASLGVFGSFDSILSDGAFRRVPLKTKLSVTTAAAVGSVAGESKTKLISRLSLSAPTLEPRKSSCIVVITEEIAKSASAAAIQLLGDELRQGVARATDADFLDSITTNDDVETITATGSDLTAFLADLNLALAIIEVSNTSRLYLIAPPRIVKALALMRGSAGSPAFPELGIQGGNVAGIAVVPSDALSSDIVLLDAQQVAADSSVVTLDDSGQSSLQIDDAPSDGATTTIDLWQHNLMALRAERWFGTELLRSNGAVVLSGDYGGVGTGT